MFTTSTTDSQKLINAIRDQTQAVPNHLVFVIDIVSVRFGGKFTLDIKAQLQKFTYLQMLTLNDCGIQSLENFPNLPGLIRLDMVFNSIKGQDLVHLKNSKHIQTLMLGANKIQKIQHLQTLKSFKKLLQLDLLNNPVVKQPGYRVQVFNLLPTLNILDTLDKGGKDAYSNPVMMQAVSRVPDSLFDKSIPPPPMLLFTPPITRVIHQTTHHQVHQQQKKKLTQALARTGSLDSIGHQPNPKKVKKPENRSKKAKISMVVAGRSKSSKAGLLFPVGRIKRHLKSYMSGSRTAVGGAVYLAATLEYLTAELLEIAGNQAKFQKKTRITPQIIRSSLKNDQQLNRMFKDVTIGMIGE